MTRTDLPLCRNLRSGCELVRHVTRGGSERSCACALKTTSDPCDCIEAWIRSERWRRGYGWRGTLLAANRRGTRGARFLAAGMEPRPSPATCRARAGGFATEDHRAAEAGRRGLSIGSRGEFVGQLLCAHLRRLLLPAVAAKTIRLGSARLVSFAVSV